MESVLTDRGGTSAHVTDRGGTSAHVTDRGGNRDSAQSTDALLLRAQTETGVRMGRLQRHSHASRSRFACFRPGPDAGSASSSAGCAFIT